MSWDWVERDLTEWAKKTLPEFLLISMQDPDNKNDCIARTPWRGYSICVGEVQVDGEANLTGRKSQEIFHFELDIGLRLDVEMDGKDEYWPGVAQIVHFDSTNLNPPIIARTEELPAGLAEEVAWYVKEGQARRYLWHALGRWHAYAVKKWTQAEPPTVASPYCNPDPLPECPPFPVPSALQPLSAVGSQVGGSLGSDAPAPERYPEEQQAVPYIGKKAVALAEDFAPPVATLDAVLEKANKRTNDYGVASPEQQVRMRVQQLCEAIEAGDLMRAFSKLDGETVRCPHPGTGRLALHYCVARGSKDLLEMVVEANADVNAKDAAGQTALMVAAKQGNEELSRLLLDKGADAAEQDSLGRTAKEMVAVVAPEEDRPLKHWQRKLGGAYSVAQDDDPAKNMRELKELIDRRERPKKYGALLLDAISQKDLRTAETAIEAGADVAIADEQGETPVLLVAKGKWRDQEEQQVRLVERMCKAGAAVNAQDARGSTPLHFAAHRGNQPLVQALLKLAAEPGAANADGNTPLMYAAHGGHEVVCVELLEGFAPADPVNKFGLSARETAHRRGFKSCAAVLQAYELAPKKRGTETATAPKKKEKVKENKGAFDYSKWDALEKEMQQDEDFEETTQRREQQSAAKRPTPKMEDLGPEAFGLPPGTPWPPPDPKLKQKGPFDYSHWEKVTDDLEKRDKARERFEELQQKPQYEWRNGQKLQVIF